MALTRKIMEQINKWKYFQYSSQAIYFYQKVSCNQRQEKSGIVFSFSSFKYLPTQKSPFQSFDEIRSELT